MSSERYTLIISPTARRQLTEQLPAAVAFAAYEFIVGPLLDNPQRVGKRLRPPLDDRHSARRGTYRVLYRIDEASSVVTVVGVFSRAEAYRAGWQRIRPLTAAARLASAREATNGCIPQRSDVTSVARRCTSSASEANHFQWLTVATAQHCPGRMP